MNPSELYETTMDPTKRNLIQVTINDAKEAEKQVNELMGKDADFRKVFLSTFEINPDDLDG